MKKSHAVLPLFLVLAIFLPATNLSFCQGQTTTTQTGAAEKDPPINVNGYLEDADGFPMEGSYAWEIEVHENPTTTTRIGEVEMGRTSVTLGIFNISLHLPTTITLLHEFWLSLAIDTNGDGIDSNDLFEDRFRIGPVPYALSGQPTTFFAVNGGAASIGGLISGRVRDLQVVPFTTPAGGVKFNRMAGLFANIGSGTGQLSFGIYDADGKGVALSGPIRLSPGGDMIVEVAIEGKLRPSALYYATWGANYGEIYTMKGLAPATPGYGQVMGVVTNGVIPVSFDPAKIEQGSVKTQQVTLTLREVPKEKGAERTTSRAARRSKSPYPPVKFYPLPMDDE